MSEQSAIAEKPRLHAFTVNLTPDDRDWCAQRADDLGLDDVAGVIKMLVRQARKGPQEPRDNEPREVHDTEEWRRQSEEQAKAERRDAIEKQRILLAEQMAELDRSLAGEMSPELLIKTPQHGEVRTELPRGRWREPTARYVPDNDYDAGPRYPEVEIPPDPDYDYRPAPQSLARGGYARGGYEPTFNGFRPRTGFPVPPAARPGAYTSPAGINPQAGYGDQMGDGMGNVMRQNNAHLGFRRS